MECLESVSTQSTAFKIQKICLTWYMQGLQTKQEAAAASPGTCRGRGSLIDKATGEVKAENAPLRLSLANMSRVCVSWVFLISPM